ncbi:MAG: endonuclease NucS [bacterium]|nr:endonuclease NucS [bacterium]
MAVWIFSNKYEGRYQDSDWDTATILKRKQYYFKASEKNRSKVSKGDLVFFREYGTGIWGTCVVGQWQDDKEAKRKHNIEAGWFPISNPQKWDVVLPYEIVAKELSNQNYRLRIAKATPEDAHTLELAKRIYERMGYGRADGELFLLEAGLEEAVKKNLKQLGLKLADENIRQQCALGIGIGRTDLICLDKNDNFVVLELKAVASSEAVIGQIQKYMGYVRENWAEKSGKQVHGIILTPTFDEGLRYAAKEAKIKVLRIRIA